MAFFSEDFNNHNLIWTGSSDWWMVVRLKMVDSQDIKASPARPLQNIAQILERGGII